MSNTISGGQIHFPTAVPSTFISQLVDGTATPSTMVQRLDGNTAPSIAVQLYAGTSSIQYPAGSQKYPVLQPPEHGVPLLILSTQYPAWSQKYPGLQPLESEHEVPPLIYSFIQGKILYDFNKTMTCVLTINNTTTETLTMVGIGNGGTNLTVQPTTTSPYTISANSLLWTAQNGGGVQYGGFPAMTTNGSNITYTINNPCSDSNVCVYFINNTGSSVVLTNIPGVGLTVYNPIAVIPGNQRISLPDKSVWTSPFLLTTNQTFTVSSTENYPIYPIVLNTYLSHVYETKYRPYMSENAILGLMITFYCVTVVLFIWSLVSNSENKSNQPNQPSQPNQQNQSTQAQNPIAALLQNNSGPGVNGKVMFVSFLFLLVALYLTLVYVSVAGRQNATYAQCAAKDGFGSVWRWATPTGVWSTTWPFVGAKSLCSIFGLCECVSDIGENTCRNYALNYPGYEWNRVAAAKSVTNGSCFCCVNGSACVDKDGNNLNC
jgi:hypothetical protein